MPKDFLLTFFSLISLPASEKLNSEGHFLLFLRLILTREHAEEKVTR